MLYPILSRIFPTTTPPVKPRRIVLIRPCCIGDVVMATGALTALRQVFPDAHMTGAIGTWSARAIAHHPALDAILDTGSADLPVRTPQAFRHFVAQLREGDFDLAVSLVRSPLMSLAVWMAGIPYRAGLDSLGRGFGYNVRVAVSPTDTRHEGEIYLAVVQSLTAEPIHAYANLPLQSMARDSIRHKLAEQMITAPYMVVHPGGGSNPGMQMDAKRYPLDRLAVMVNGVAQAQNAHVIIIGGRADRERVHALQSQLNVPSYAWVEQLSFEEIGALAQSALCYIGNDTGLTHLASASGAKTVMMMGPTDPVRYAPFTASHCVLWKPTTINTGGVAMADTRTWHWDRDGFDPLEGVGEILIFLSSVD